MDFLNVKTMQFPREVVAGHGVLHVRPELISREFKRGRVAIISGQKTYEMAGRGKENILRRAENSLSPDDRGSGFPG